jgi:hypothetical protein
MDDVFARFIKDAPIAVMVRACLSHLMADSTLNELFDRHAEAQYTRALTFSTLWRLMSKVVFRVHDSVNAAYRNFEEIAVSITAVYDKLNRLETGISEALVRETGEAAQGIIHALPHPPDDAIAGLHVRTLDGNFLAGTDHRLDGLRLSGAAALPGMSLVVRDGRTGVLTNLVACEDAYTSERSLFPEILALVRPDDLWLADRNFCTLDYLGGIAERRAYFLIRHHAGTKLQPLGESRFVGSNATGDLWEQAVGIGGFRFRCIIVKLHKPLRDGTTEIRLITNVPCSRAGAKRLAELYRTRWHIETAFQELTDYLRCEINTLGYPKAALFGFALALTAYNLMMVIKQALASGQGRQQVETELSGYYLAEEVATVSHGLAIALPEATWDRFAEMSTPEMANWLQRTARSIDWRRYRKNKRGPKKAVQVKRTQRGAHRSTARVLENNHTKAP